MFQNIGVTSLLDDLSNKYKKFWSFKLGFKYVTNSLCLNWRNELHSFCGCSWHWSPTQISDHLEQVCRADLPRTKMLPEEPETFSDESARCCKWIRGRLRPRACTINSFEIGTNDSRPENIGYLDQLSMLTTFGFDRS